MSSTLEFTALKDDFLRELALVRDAAEKKTTIPILANVLIEAEGDTVTLTASDLELVIRSSCPAKVKRAGSCTMPARKLHDYVHLLPTGEVAVKVKDDHWCALNGGRNRARIAGMARESFPELPSVPDSIASIPVTALCAMIGRTSFAVSSEESRFTLNGCLLIFSGRAITMVATDGHRLAFTEQARSAEVLDPLRLLIPKRAMGEIAKLGADAPEGASVEIAADENHLFFQIGHRLLIARKLTGSFPDYERVLPKGDAHVATIDRAGLQSALARVAQFADERSRACRVEFKAGELRAFASSVESGESEESIACEYAGPDMEIGFNASYLMEFLSVSPGPNVLLRVTDEKNAGELRPASEAAGDQYRYVVMPMRI
jgi:DNA polymerase III subunit beta